jgi:hypothetical protein
LIRGLSTLMPRRGVLLSPDTRFCIALGYWTGVQTLPPARLFSSWVLQDSRYEMVDATVWRQVKGEARESPVRFLEYFPLEGVTEALRSHSRGSQRVIEVYSLLALNLVRDLCPAPPHPRDHHVIMVGGAGKYCSRNSFS